MDIPEDLLLAAADSMSNVEKKRKHIFRRLCKENIFFFTLSQGSNTAELNAKFIFVYT